MPDTSGKDFSHLFIVTYGRSGSTTLQALLNSIPGYLIRGEHHQAPHFLYQYHQTLLADHRRFKDLQEREKNPIGPLTPSNPFFGVDDFSVDVALSEYAKLITTTILRPDQETRVTGYKEIRWYQPDVLDFIEWLRLVFPGSRFLINSRRHEDVAQSKWWAQDPDALKKLARIQETFTEVAQRLDHLAFHVQYEEWNGNPEAFRSLYEWLDEPFDLEVVGDVLSRYHSFK
ncbi:sulfotransferase [Ornithinimicrobium faecis]|uniref:Sulfotransferase n=1 Tax=Ornithinimicrobium faecis TaxID=2934158 RepID=A0ABY4YU54_9MICO|nr:sulfotransferase [Ornithinimicrobium sp. HY1793]USQ79805.1 sulfotransferase [Ornithinimicrobium sp. HY1793]